MAHDDGNYLCVADEACGRPGYCRGLCHAHYESVRHAVNRGETSWLKLEGEGRAVAPSSKRTTAPRDWWKKAPAAPAPVAPPLERSHPTCRAPECQRSVYSRGLCHSDYTAVLAKVKAGALAWTDLEAAGLAAPPKRRIPESRDWLDAAKPAAP